MNQRSFVEMDSCLSNRMGLRKLGWRSDSISESSDNDILNQ